MAKKYETLRNRMSPAAREASAAEYRRLIEQMSLLELRKAKDLTQAQVAEQLHMGQGDVSKIERRTDMYVSTLAHYLHAVGADLEIRAVFKNGQIIRITQFSENPGNDEAPLKVRTAGGG
jgi:transcriptional regulator with XRE-family HTH domain